jgi:hypothetical protein
LITESQFATPIRGVSDLTDAERALLLGDAVDGVAHRDGLSHQAAAALLDQAAARGAAHLVGDVDHAGVVVDGQVVVELPRAELRALAGVR